MKLLNVLEAFIVYGEKKLGLNELDEVYAKNKLYAHFNVYPAGEVLTPEKISDVDGFVAYFTSYYQKMKLPDYAIEQNIAELFDIISPRPSEVVKVFNSLLKQNPKLATSYLYNLGVNNYYIHQKAIKKNVEWVATYPHAPSLEISINLSKPEKNNKDIAKLLQVKKENNYPKCVLCLENLGFAGNAKRAPRQNIRMIPMKLMGEDWFMQYSPYGYFKEHMILVDQKHEPMEISTRIFKILFAFLKVIPHYTIVSNSDLPIVGGSILNHEHFQGGNYVFPLQKAKDLYLIKQHHYPRTKISVLDFYNTALKLSGKNPNEIIDAASLILKKWRNYTDTALAIKPGHNTVTPILRINKDHYEMVLILRCNSVSEKYPDGIYHVHPEYFGVKQEGIGVIEACGRFILPARLLRQMTVVEKVAKAGLSEKAYLKQYPDLKLFKPYIDALKKHPKMRMKDYINLTGQAILDNTSVFKKDQEGMNHLHRFIKSLALWMK